MVELGVGDVVLVAGVVLVVVGGVVVGDVVVGAAVVVVAKVVVLGTGIAMYRMMVRSSG